MQKTTWDKIANFLQESSQTIQKKYGSRPRVMSAKVVEMEEQDPNSLPSPPMYVMTLRWSEEDGIVVDTRGFTIMEAWGILQRSADEVSALIDDPIVILDGENMDAVLAVSDDEDDDEDYEE